MFFAIFFVNNFFEKCFLKRNLATLVGKGPCKKRLDKGLVKKVIFSLTGKGCGQ
jgi:hypothetical protein